jgi:hypothetical protein
VEDVYRALLRRTQEAVEKGTGDTPTLCAWCGRVEVGGQWIDARSLLTDVLLERLRDKASHGICPDCFDRVSAEAERQRTRRTPRLPS